MPSTLSYPGVYIEEKSSGVHTITGVATSIAAFVGAAPRGPIDEAVHLFSFPDYERSFGGLSADSEMGYAVRQFFRNGGSEAYAVRVVKDATGATADLANSSTPAVKVLAVTAIDSGADGNSIEISVDWNTPTPQSTFNLALSRQSDGLSETFNNLSMNSADPRYVVSVVNDTSKLVTVARSVDPTTQNQVAGTSTSAPLPDVATLLDASHNEFRISADGLPPVKVVIAIPADVNNGATPADRLTNLCKATIEAQVRAQAAGHVAYAQFSCQPDGTAIKMISGTKGEKSSVRVLPGQSHNASALLKLGSESGGVDVDGAAPMRPKAVPDCSTVTSGAFGANDLDALPDATHTSLAISLDGAGPDEINIKDTAAAVGNLAAKLKDVAQRIEDAVQALKPGKPAYQNFTCQVDATNTKLVLATGTPGADGSVAVFTASSNSIADELHLLGGSSTTRVPNLTLQGGSEIPFSAAAPYTAFIGDEGKRTGIYALEAVDLFNLLCLPGITDPGVLADSVAYCEKRRAFMIVDAPSAPGAGSPDDMVKVALGTDLPKSDHAAVYFPWVQIPDPLNNGKLRLTPPSGTMAGLYARTDANRGVWKAPAGTEASLTDVQGLGYAMTDPQNGSLNLLGVNCLRIFPVFGAVSWGARTLRGADMMTSDYKYVPVRRLALFLEESLYRGTQWIVFEPNDEPLWAQIRLNLGAFMHTLFVQGAFQGNTPQKAYFVKCDSETTTQDDINRGVVNILVGFAPLKPAEFVVIQIQQIAGQILT